MKRAFGNRVQWPVTAALVLAVLLASGCGTGQPVTKRAKYWERAELMYTLNRPNTTGENPDTETSDSTWWFY